MKVFTEFGKYQIINDSCLKTLKSIKDSSITTVVADWPFKLHNKLLPEVIKESKRVLIDGGTLISVIYPDLNYLTRKLAEEAGFIFAEEIILPMKVSYSMGITTLPNRTMGIMSLVKGSLNERKWQPPLAKNVARILEANSKSHYIPTNFWFEKYFKNGYKNKWVGKHSEAMPRWVVEKMFKTIIPKEGTILDLFGGAGTIFANAWFNKIPCITSEIDENNCKIIYKRLYNY
jgi:DNA modification methylase